MTILDRPPLSATFNHWPTVDPPWLMHTLWRSAVTVTVECKGLILDSLVEAFINGYSCR
jgi:hypothetical protein